MPSICSNILQFVSWNKIEVNLFDNPHPQIKQTFISEWQ